MKGRGHLARATLASVATAGLLLLGVGLSFTRPDAVKPPEPRVQIPKGVLIPAGTARDEGPKNLTPDQVPAGALVPAGPPPAVTLLATGDVVGYLEPCG